MHPKVTSRRPSSIHVHGFLTGPSHAQFICKTHGHTCKQVQTWAPGTLEAPVHIKTLHPMTSVSSFTQELSSFLGRGKPHLHHHLSFQDKNAGRQTHRYSCMTSKLLSLEACICGNTTLELPTFSCFVFHRHSAFPKQKTVSDGLSPTQRNSKAIILSTWQAHIT